MKQFKNIITYIWQLPQHLLALIIKNHYPIIKVIYYKTSIIYIIKKGRFAISLGKYIFINENFSKNPMARMIPHEYGHSIQSKILGPLYLIIVGIPSITQNKLSSFLKKRGHIKMSQNYYNRFPENWADRLGKVKR